MKRYMGTIEDRERIKTLLNKESVGWRKERLVALQKGFQPHDSEHPNVPPGIHIVTLPPYSPELNPIERLWDMIQDQTANKLWPTNQESLSRRSLCRSSNNLLATKRRAKRMPKPVVAVMVNMIKIWYFTASRTGLPAII